MGNVDNVSLIVRAVDAFHKLEEIEDLLNIAIEQEGLPTEGEKERLERYERVLRLLHLYMREKQKPFNKLKDSLYKLYALNPFVLR